MDYIRQLRQYLGHRPIIMVGAAVLVLDGKDRLLMMKRTDIACWGIPGGSMEPGESVEDAARREAHEETNLGIGDMILFGVFSGPDLYYKYPNGDEVFNVSIVYTTNDWHGEIILNDEHSDWQWFAANAIPEDISPPVKTIIERYKNSFSKQAHLRNHH